MRGRKLIGLIHALESEVSYIIGHSHEQWLKRSALIMESPQFKRLTRREQGRIIAYWHGYESACHRTALVFLYTHEGRLVRGSELPPRMLGENGHYYWRGEDGRPPVLWV